MNRVRGKKQVQFEQGLLLVAQNVAKHEQKWRNPEAKLMRFFGRPSNKEMRFA